MIDKAKLKALRYPIELALEGIGAANGVKLRLGNASYDPTLGTFTFKLEGCDATGEAPELVLLKRYAEMYSIDLSYLDRDLIANGNKAFRLCGLQAKGRGEAKCLATGPDGKTYLFKVRSFWTAARKEQERDMTLRKFDAMAARG